jgi:hypothetical protein
MARPYVTTRPKGFLSPKGRKRKSKTRAPRRRARLTTDLCRFDIDTNTVLDAVTRAGAIDWTRVKRLANRYPDDAGLGTALRTFIWATARGGPGIAKLAKETRRYQRFTCARADSGAVAKFKRKFPRRL